MIWESIKMAVGSIRSAKMRSFLTMLGIIIGISSVVAINSVGAGLKQQVAGQVNQLGANLVFVVPGQIISGGPGKERLNPGASVGTSTLTQQDVTTVKHTPTVNNVTYFSLISGIVSQGSTQDGGALLLATTPTYLDVLQSQKIDKGRFIQSSDGSDYVAVLGGTARDTLFGKNTEVAGKTVMIRGAQFKVVGVMQTSGSGATSIGGPSLDDAVYMPVDAAKKLTGTEPSITRIGVQIDNQNDINPAVDKIKAELKANHGGQEDFSVLTQKDLLSTVDTILNALTKAISAIAAIALVVGGIGIMNIMLVAVTERTREIGIRKAIGATRTMILLQFLVEAAVLSLLGGGLGMLAAVGLGRAAGRAIKITPVFTSQIIITAVGIAVGIGIIFGLAPAIKASRKSPMEALRYE